MADPFLGEIKMCAFTFAPKGWAFCDGQTMTIQQYSALYSLLGTTFGGNGTTTFMLPDMRGRTPLHTDFQTYPRGATGGAETVTITEATMATHDHGFNVANETADKTNPTNRLPAIASVNAYAAPTNLVAMNSASITPNTGAGGAAHPNIQPSLVVNFIIALVGLYPTRN